ncbi:hypothetical protein R3P38DRAFT_2756437 [Favolaschia claudopus]|uniref:Uncharacterized protein n=1 Tax=Favolaschia claudopus TaxID=2862362 RepID=A0AAW0EFA6_9AGAR
MSLSVLEALSILEPLDPTRRRFQGLLASQSQSYSGASDDEDKGLHKWLDALASLLKSLSGSPPKQVCALSMSLVNTGCTVTVAFNAKNEDPENVSHVMHSIWNWMKEASVLPSAEMPKKNEELLIIILKASLDKIRRRLQEKGWFVSSVIETGGKSGVLTSAQKKLLLVIASLQHELLRFLGSDADTLNFSIAAQMLCYRAEEYKKVNQDVYWLRQYEELVAKPGMKWPSLIRHMEKLLKPYNQFQLIGKFARRPFMRGAVASIPLFVNILPSPSTPSQSVLQPIEDYETRVRAYLQSVLESFSPDDASSPHAEAVIAEFWQRKVKDVVQPSPLVPAHCECVLLRHHLDLHIHNIAAPPYPYFGVSRPLCFQLGPSFDTRLPNFFRSMKACAALPVCARGNDEADRAIERQMSIQLEKIFGELLQNRVAEQRELKRETHPLPIVEEYLEAVRAETLALHPHLRP